MGVDPDPIHGLRLQATSTFAGMKAAADLKRAIRKMMVTVLMDRILHAEIVAAGVFRFRTEFVRDLGPAWGKARGPADELANHLFSFFRVQWAEKYPAEPPQWFLDKVRLLSPPTEAEIDDAWEVEIGSSDAAMRSMYEGSARTRKGRDLGERKGR